MKSKYKTITLFILILTCMMILPLKTSAASKKKKNALEQPKVFGAYQDKKVTLKWEKVKGAEKYLIFKQNENKIFEKIASVTEFEYIDNDVLPNKRFKYKICAAVTKDNATVKSKKTALSVYTAKINPKKKMIALTFDDGPGKYTKKIAKCLEEHNSRATFFVVGNRINYYKDGLQYAYDVGCEIGNHSYTHANFHALSAGGLKSQIKKTDKAIMSITGEPVNVLRTPGGARSSLISKHAGKPMFYWSIDTCDWKTRNTKQIVKSVMSKVKDGDVILIHEIYDFSSDAILQLIPKLRKKGFQLVTISELAYYKGYELKDGKVYYSFP